jgi:Ser/Thr protein kinase RdoA (MazF antagonist)
VRLFTYVPGIPISSIHPSRTLLVNAGRSLAGLDLALAGVSRSPPRQNFIWSVQHALDLLPMLDALSNSRTRDLVTVAFENFRQRTAPGMDGLRRQLIHNDFNATNVLVDAGRSDHVSGVIDFGDLTIGPLINDLAVAASRHASPDDPLPGISAVCSGYISAIRLWPEEANALFDLICLRFAMRLTIWAASAAARGSELNPEIEGPEVKALSALFESSAQQRISGMATA